MLSGIEHVSNGLESQCEDDLEVEAQIFRNDVGQAVAGDLVNSGVVINVGGSDDGPDQDLVPAQRYALHALVRQITEEFEDEPWDVWRMVHARLGITCLNDLSRTQFELAESVLQRYLDGKREESVIRGLVAKILRISAEKDNLAAVEFFCTRNYGTSQLKGLGRTQLQAALGYAHDWVPPSTPSQYVKPPPIAVTTPSLHDENADWSAKMYGWRWPGATFIVGFVLGRFF